MKVGDLVKFHTGSWVFDDINSQYANPGIVISCSDPTQCDRDIAEVYWRNGKVTREHSSYLLPFMYMEVIDESR
jgi:hypothetical protein